MRCRPRSAWVAPVSPVIVNVVSGRARPARYSRVWKMMRWFSLQNHLSSITPAGSGSVYQYRKPVKRCSIAARSSGVMSRRWPSQMATRWSMSKSLVSRKASILSNTAAKSSGPMADASKAKRRSRSARVRWASTFVGEVGDRDSVAKAR